MPRRFLNELPHFIVTIQVEYVSDQFKRVLVVIEIGIQSCQIEAVREVIFIDFAKVLVASRRDELWAYTSARVLPNVDSSVGFWQITLDPSRPKAKRINALNPNWGARPPNANNPRTMPHSAHNHHRRNTYLTPWESGIG